MIQSVFSSQNAKERRRIRGRRSLENPNAEMNIVKVGNNEYTFLIVNPKVQARKRRKRY